MLFGVVVLEYIPPASLQAHKWHVKSSFIFDCAFCVGSTRLVPKNLDFTGVLAVLSFESRAKVTAKFRSGEGSSEWIKKLKIPWWRHRVGSSPTTGTT